MHLGKLKSLLFIALLLCGEGYAGNVYDYLVHLGPVQTNKTGAIRVPQQVLGALTQGKVSPILQLVLQNHMMNSCVKSVMKNPPGRRTAYVQAARIFDDGVCKISKCFQNAMVMSMLSQMSDNPSVGGSSSATGRQGSQQMALMLATAFNKDKCGSHGGGQGFDPMLLMLLQQGS